MAPGPLLPETMSFAAMERKGGGEEAVSGANSANQSLNPVGMQIYWNLSSLNMAVREAAAVALVRELREKQGEFAAGGGRDGVAEVLRAKENDGELEGCAPAVQYALGRLLRGLGSSRECARQGFSTALTAVVETLPVLRGGALLRIIPSNLEVTASMKKQDARDGLLGRLFAYGCVVRAKRLIGDGTSSEEKELANGIVEELFTLAKLKTFLREPAVTLVIELASRLPSSAFRETVCTSPLFDEWLRRDLESQSAEALLLVLQVHDKLPAQSSPLVPESGNLQDLFDPSHLAKLIPCLKESSSSHPRVHAVWHLLLDCLFASANSHSQGSAMKNRAKSGSSEDVKDIKKIESNLANFWSVVVEGALLTSSHERKNLAMELLLLILPRLPTPESVSIVLSNLFVRFILHKLSSKDTLLHKSAKRCLSELCLWAASSNLRRAAVIVGLQKTSYGNFDTLSKSCTVKALIKGFMTEDGVLAFVHSLQELFLAAESTVQVSEELVKGSEDVLVNGTDKIAANDRIWIVEQMCILCKEVKLEPKTAQASLYKEVMKFFIAHSLFEASNQQNFGDPEKKDFMWPQKSLPVNVRKLIAERLQSILITAEHWMADQKSRSAGAFGVKEAVAVDEDFSHLAASICLSIQNSTDAVLVQPLKEESAESVKILQQTVSTLSSAVKSETNGDELKRMLALRSLLSLLLLESFLEPGSTDDIAAELAICCSKAFPGLQQLSTTAPSVEVEEGSEETPPLMDVLLDVILSLLAKASSPVREAVEKVFRLYCKDLTGAGMTDFLRILKKGSNSRRRNSMLEEGEEDADDDDDILEDDEDEEVEGDGGKAKVAKAEGEDEEEDEDDDEEEDVEMGDGDGESRTLQQQMTFKRPGEDLDDEAEVSDSDVSDMDDEAMFRADVLLANVLKLKKLSSKANTQTELANFKFRVLSLLEYYLHKFPGSSLVLLAVQGLLKTFVNTAIQLGKAPKENEVLMKRLETLLRGVFNHKDKKYPRGEDVDLSLIRRLLEQSWKLASRSSIKRVPELAQECTRWTLKVLVGNVPDIEEKGDAELSEFVAKSLEHFFSNRKSLLKVLFWSQAFHRHPVLGRFSIGILIEKAGNGRTMIRKCEAMSLLTQILKPVTCAKAKKRRRGTQTTQTPVGEEPKLPKLLAKAFEEHLESLGAVILSTIQSPPQRRDQRLIALAFWIDCIDALGVLFPQKTLHSVVDTAALLAGLKAIDVPRQGRPHQLFEKLVETVTVELAKNPVNIQTTKADDNKSPSTKKVEDGELPFEISKDENTSSKKKAEDGEVPMEINKDNTPSSRKKAKKSDTVTQPEEVKTPSSKRKKARTEEAAAMEVQISVETPASQKKRQMSSKKEGTEEAAAMEVQVSEETPGSKKKHRTSSKKARTEEAAAMEVQVSVETPASKKKRQMSSKKERTEEAAAMEVHVSEETPGSKKKHRMSSK